jgi:hypothetical protein
MSNPAQETKVELVTEAIETLVLAQVVALRPDHDRYSGPRAHENVALARKCLHDALKELLTPTLRVMTNTKLETIPAADARPAYPAA